MTKSHPESVLSHLYRHGDITPMEAWNVYGCYRLSSVINRLRNRGHAIGTRMREDDVGKQYAQYYLVIEPYNQTDLQTGHQDTLELPEPDEVAVLSPHDISHTKIGL